MVNNDHPHEDSPMPPEDDDANVESPLEDTTYIESMSSEDDVPPGSNSTLLPIESEANESSSDDAKPGGADDRELDVTVANLETTTHVDDEQDIEATAAIDKTVGDGVDQTVELDSVDAIGSSSAGNLSTDHPTVYSGKNRRGKAKVTVRDAQEETAESFDSNPSVDTVDSSVLASANIDETINPRELSKEDANAWDTAVGSENVDSDYTLDPDGDPNQTLVDRQFGRLRRHEVAPLKKDPSVTDDYKLVRKLGQGGMGDVFVARQGSLNRLLALKLIKPLDGKKKAQLEKTGKLASVEEERRQQFLSEAIVTGDLDHPNIVPIHDVALTSNNELFYVMKRVVGKPWSKEIKKTSQDENIEILLKACDAIAFAHERGVVHRDIKPENIMLGDFGVVMVMDWGLALPTSNYEKQNSIFATSGLGGTPAFMAPEMATGPLENIGPASDIYLLGATLFMIVTGSAPHKAKNVTECLKAVRRNTIRAVPAEKQGELLDIALRAMATEPKDRYPDVASFQRAIRDYRAHAESISLTVRASDDLKRAREERSYASYSRAAFRFEEALKSWPGNEKAQAGSAETTLAHADTAYSNGDFDLGLSLLDREAPEHQELIGKLEAGIAERDSHAARVSALKKLALAMLAFILVGGSAAMYYIEQKRSEATESAEAERVAKEIALEAEGVAKHEKEKAEAAAESERVAKISAQNAAIEEAKAKVKAQDAAIAEAKAKVEAEDAALKARDEQAKAEAAEQVAIDAK
ncbi:MAG: protein kinase domain-containing protein, partial [Rubripirellula sp.]